MYCNFVIVQIPSGRTLVVLEFLKPEQRIETEMGTSVELYVECMLEGFKARMEYNSC